MFSILNISEEEKNRRRQLTDFAVKLTILAAGAGLVVELLYYFLGLSPEQRELDWEFRRMIPVTVTALGLLTIMLGVNRLKVIPYWVSSTIFLLAMTILALFSDSPEQVMNGRSTLFFLAPILLSGVLIHSNATFIFSSLVTTLFAAYAMLTSGSYLNPLNIIFFYTFSGLVSMR